jgi:hypothetical protein
MPGGGVVWVCAKEAPIKPRLAIKPSARTARPSEVAVGEWVWRLASSMVFGAQLMGGLLRVSSKVAGDRGKSRRNQKAAEAIINPSRCSI